MTTPAAQPNPPGSSQPPDGGTKEPETQEYTIKSVNTGLLGSDVKETVIVKTGKGKPDEYGAGDKVSLTETQYKSLQDAGVKFES
jgi:hypothetical protein